MKRWKISPVLDKTIKDTFYHPYWIKQLKISPVLDEKMCKVPPVLDKIMKDITNLEWNDKRWNNDARLDITSVEWNSERCGIKPWNILPVLNEMIKDIG